MGPFKVIGSVSHELEWAHLRFAAAFLISKMGPSKLIGSVSHEQGWAHSRFAAVFLMSKDGPIQGLRQCFS